MDVDGNGCMPAFSDPPYPCDCLVKAFAATFERWQRVTGRGVLRMKRVGFVSTHIAGTDGVSAFLVSTSRLFALPVAL
jgi:hypothetical protein